MLSVIDYLSVVFHDTVESVVPKSSSFDIIPSTPEATINEIFEKLSTILTKSLEVTSIVYHDALGHAQTVGTWEDLSALLYNDLVLNAYQQTHVATQSSYLENFFLYCQTTHSGHNLKITVGYDMITSLGEGCAYFDDSRRQWGTTQTPATHRHQGKRQIIIHFS
jgi:hypothetical protein